MYYAKRTSTNKRTYPRHPYQIECILSNESAAIKSQTVDVSILGMGVLVNGTTPFEIGDRLTVSMTSMQYQSLAEVRWAEKDINKNTTRIGLKLFSSIL